MAFTEQRLDRARKRTVAECDGGWIVYGERSLDDTRDVYYVRLMPTKQYHCTCYDHAGGQFRAKQICSHVLAVILYRKTQRDQVPPATPPSAGDVAKGTTVSTASPVVPSPRAPIFNSKLPDWVESIRPHQWDAVQEIVDGFNSGCDAVFVDAPTGSGKTLIGRMAAAMLGGNALYVCSDKSLQDQFVRDFPSAVLKGRANYEPEGWDGKVNCGDCTLQGDDDCQWCEESRYCPYLVAKYRARAHELAVLNTSYLLTEANTSKPTFGGKRRNLIIVDECDVLEKELMGYVEAAITERRAKELRIGRPEHVTKMDSVANWVRWTVLPSIGKALEAIDPHAMDVRTIRKRSGLKRLLDSFRFVPDGLDSGKWIFDGYQNGGAVFKPVRVDKYGPDVLWRHANKWLLMSATIISSDELADSLGFPGVYRTVMVPMTFPVENRRIHVAPVANMAAKNAETEWPKMAKALANLMELHSTERILVHTVSYKLAEYLDAQLLNRRVMTYRGAMDRERVLERFRRTDAAVLLAPSMDRGISLDDDDCRVVVVAKVPFPYIGDKQVSARLHSEGGNRWYAVQAARSLVQMTGRAVRSDTDYATNYILDAQFRDNLFKKNAGLLPKWWTDSLNWEFPTRTLR